MCAFNGEDITNDRTCCIAQINIQNFQTEVLNGTAGAHQQVTATSVIGDAVGDCCPGKRAKIISRIFRIIQMQQVVVAATLPIDDQSAANIV